MAHLTSLARPQYATPFADYLDPGERLLWYGQPRQGIYLRSSDAIAIPFTIMWGGFALFWEGIALHAFLHGGGGRPPILFPLWGIPFVLVGLYLMVGRFFVDARTRRYTWYGVTDRRALIVSGSAARRLTSYVLGTLGEIQLTSFGDGTGTITFNAGGVVLSGRNANNAFGGAATTSFERVPDAGEVYRLVRQVQNGGQQGR